MIWFETGCALACLFSVILVYEMLGLLEKQRALMLELSNLIDDKLERLDAGKPASGTDEGGGK